MIGRNREHPAAYALKPAAWAALGLAGLLLIASLLGNGAGLFGVDALRATAWLWVFIGVAAAALATLLWIFLRGATDAAEV